jgi:hypothetical protein
MFTAFGFLCVNDLQTAELKYDLGLQSVALFFTE